MAATENQAQPGTMRGDLAVLFGLAAALFVLHMLTNHQYGFHRDELATLDDARRLDWGYVAYPPLAPLLARISLELFGTSLVGFRLFAVLAQCGVLVLAGLIARDLGGTRFAQVVAAVATAMAPIALIQGAVFQYVGIDYLWWVLLAYLAVRLINSGDARWWLAIGAVIGLGMMTKYTMAYMVAGLAGGVLLTQGLRPLRQRWLWAGAALSLLIFLPNLVWQVQNDFVSLDFLQSIHDRDVEIGRTDGYLPEQLLVSTSPVTLPLWLAGLYFSFFRPEGKRYRLLGWMYVIPFLLFLVTQGRSYYLAPAYPMLFAAGAVLWERWLSQRSEAVLRIGRTTTATVLGIGAVASGLLALPLAPINSAVWNVSSETHDTFVEQVGWPDLTDTVAEIYFALPEDQRARTAILTSNYGQAGAINLYGPARNLPGAISGVNSYWYQGYGEPPPEMLIVLGFTPARAGRFFAECEPMGRITNRYGVENEESTFPFEILLCSEPHRPWPQLWEQMRSFG